MTTGIRAQATINPSFRANGNVTARVTVPDIASDEHVVSILLADSGHRYEMTVEDINAISYLAYNAESTLNQLLDKSRMTYHHPLVCDAGRDLLMPFGGRNEIIGLADSHKVCPAGTVDFQKDNVPVLQWIGTTDIDGAAGVGPGWRLSLVGAPTLSLGFAHWQDTAKIDGLIRQMEDVDTLMIMAGMLSPADAGRISSRMNAHAVMEERLIKNVTLRKIRKILVDNGLGTADHRSRSDRGIGRVLTIPLGQKTLPVACALLVPVPDAAHNEWMEFTRVEEHSTMTYHDRQVKREEINKRHQAVWKASFLSALTSLGWHTLDLPKPKMGWRFNGREVVWVSPVNDEVWDLIKAAATDAAERLEMSRGSAF